MTKGGELNKEVAAELKALRRMNKEYAGPVVLACRCGGQESASHRETLSG
jgi:hypothetical protein